MCLYHHEMSSDLQDTITRIGDRCSLLKWAVAKTRSCVSTTVVWCSWSRWLTSDQVVETENVVVRGPVVKGRVLGQFSHQKPLELQTHYNIIFVLFSNGGNGGANSRSTVTLQDIVRSDPGYTSNIEHLVFPERKNSNPNLVPAGLSPPSKTKSGGHSASGMSRLAEVFARHYARGSSQDSAAVTSRKNHVNVSLVDC